MLLIAAVINNELTHQIQDYIPKYCSFHAKQERYATGNFLHINNKLIRHERDASR